MMEKIEREETDDSPPPLAMIIPKALNDFRMLIYELCRDFQFDEIGKLARFEIVDRAENWRRKRGRGYDCIDYVFGRDQEAPWVTELTDGGDLLWIKPRGYDEVTPAQPGDLVVYYRDGRPKHYGIYDGRGFAKSKFGVAHVYRHPLEHVPIIYGREIRFFRRSKSREGT